MRGSDSTGAPESRLRPSAMRLMTAMVMPGAMLYEGVTLRANPSRIKAEHVCPPARDPTASRIFRTSAHRLSEI